MQTLLKLLTWKDVENYLADQSIVLVPIGSTEQHGPNGIIGTDFVCAEAIAERVGAECGVLVAPTINVGMAMHHMAFPGTITLRPETLMSVIRDVVWSLYQHGFRRVVFVNGHGGNISVANAAFSVVREEMPEVQLEWINWWRACGAMAQQRFGDREGSHATPSEVSLTMAVYPNDVRQIEGPLDIEICRVRGVPGSVKFREYYPDGRMASDPSLATPEHGEAFLASAVSTISERVRGWL